MNKYCQKIGKKGEKIAVQYCKAMEYLIIDTHFTSCWGEIDIVAKDKGEFVFIEVKSRTTKFFGEPEESITKEKIVRLAKTIATFLPNHPEVLEYRIDVITVFFINESCPSIEHIKRIELLGEQDINNGELEI